MALSIKNPEVEQIARDLAKQTGETLTEVILEALRERFRRVTGRGHPIKLADQLDEISQRCSALPVLDTRNEDEILGYNQHGLPN